MRFRWSVFGQEDPETRIQLGGNTVSNPTLTSLPLPAKDRPVLAAAIHPSCGALVTGDRTHFGALYGRTIHGVTNHSPRSLAEALPL